MKLLQHIIEPVGLLLTWQPQDEHAKIRTRRIVGEITKSGEGFEFNYLKNTEDFKKAKEAGFKGYPAFHVDTPVPISANVLEPFLRRLPPRKREDFGEFLKAHGLPHPFEYSDFALLGYTGARLPSDGFSLTPVFPDDVAPCEFILEVAGFRYCKDADIKNLSIGDTVDFAIDPDNPVDQDAISIWHKGLKIGYVNRALRNTFNKWLSTFTVAASVERLNGKLERPLVYLRVLIKK